MKNKDFVMTITVICFILGLIFTMQIKTVKKNTETTTLSRTSELQAQYSELKKEYDSGNIKPTENTKVKQTVEESTVLNNILGFIKNKLGGR